MADNTTLNTGTGGDVIATDDIAGVKHQRVKIEHGADGSATDVSSASPLPVTLANTGANSTAVKVDGSAVTQPVSGTFYQATQPVSAASLPLPSGAATSAKQDTEISSLASIDGKLPAQGQALAAASVPVVLTAAQVTTLTPPAAITGFATSAKQDTGNTSLASIDGKITAVNTGAVVLAAGSAKIGTVTTDQTTHGTTDLVAADITKVAGSAISQGHGTAAAAIRVELPTDGTGTVGLNAGTNAIGKLAANSGVDIGDVDITSIAAGDNNIGNVDIVTVPTDPFGANADAASATGSISAKLRFIASTGIPVTGTVTVGSHAVTNAGTFAVQATEADGANTTLGAKSDAKSTATDTTAISAMSVLKQISASVQAPPSQAVTNAGTFATQAACTGDVAHDSSDSGAPVKQGAKATTALSGLTLVADADRTNLFAGVDGVQIVRVSTCLEDIVRGNTSNTDGASTQVIAAAGSGIKNYLTDVTLTNMSSTGIYVELKSGTAVMYTCPLPANGGFTKSFNPPLPPNAANEAWNVDGSAAITTLYASMIGFKSKV